MNIERYKQMFETMFHETILTLLQLDIGYWQLWGAITGFAITFCLLRRKGFLSLVSFLVLLMSVLIKLAIYLSLSRKNELFLISGVQQYAYLVCFATSVAFSFYIIRSVISTADDIKTECNRSSKTY